MSSNIRKRTSFATRLGFILVTAGCAVGLGNVWRFPYITGQSGGAFFVILYLLFLICLGIPMMSVELAIGRASRKSIAQAFTELRENKKGWNCVSYASMTGLYLLMSYYSVISGWLLYYCYQTFTGDIIGISETQIGENFSNLMADPTTQITSAVSVLFLASLVCVRGLRNGIERMVKPSMLGMLVIMVIMIFHSCSLEGASEGLSFYLYPNWDAVEKIGFGKVLYNALTQVFFSLSIGIGSIMIFGSYMSKEHSIIKEGFIICVLDTVVAFMAGLIIFPSCFSYNISPSAGPTLVFETMLQLFNKMPHGHLWGSLFFLFLTIAALTTVIAVVEAIIKGYSELFSVNRFKSTIINFFAISALAVPVALGSNKLSFIQPFGEGSSVLSLFDFIVSNNLLPLGAIMMVLFCVSKIGWGWNNYLNEINTGSGIKLPAGKWVMYYYKYFIVLVVVAVLVIGYYDVFIGIR